MFVDQHHQLHDWADKYGKRNGGGERMKTPTPTPNGMLTALQYFMENPDAGKIVSAFGMCAGVGLTLGSYLLYTRSAAALKGV